jgi:hypothetical protein
MADFRTLVDKQKDLTTITVTGLLTIDDISNAISDYYNNPTRFVLWDSNDSQLNELSAVDLEKATKMISHLKTDNSAGKTAFILGNDNFGLGVLFEGLTKIENLPREYRSFTSREEAIRWLSERCP